MYTWLTPNKCAIVSQDRERRGSPNSVMWCHTWYHALAIPLPLCQVNLVCFIHVSQISHADRLFSGNFARYVVSIEPTRLLSLSLPTVGNLEEQMLFCVKEGNLGVSGKCYRHMSTLWLTCGYVDFSSHQKLHQYHQRSSNPLAVKLQCTVLLMDRLHHHKWEG